MNNSPFAQKPIRLVSVTQQGKYEIHPDGANFLSHIQKPLGVVSVAGLYRTGKSYLLNRMLLNKSSGFGVGSTINACTKGLWCWGTPIKGTTPDGEKINVIIIDSEGIGALDEDQNHDTKIFTLAVLSASTFIYNSVGSIDQNALQNLSLVVNLSKNIQINAHSEDEDVDPEELAEYFPSFCWVVRDFSLQLINGNGDTITPNQYLERALALQKGFSDDIEDKNRIRRLLTSFFKARDCITMVRPLVNESKLQQLQKLQLEELRPQFVEQVLQLRKKILQRLNPKKFKNQLLDGKMYLNIMRSYVTAINEGAVPNMQNAWSYMCQEKCYQTFQDCLQLGEKQLREMEESIPVEIEKMNQFCESVQEEMVRKFSEETKGMERERTELLGELKHKIRSLIKESKKLNEKQSLTLLKSYAFKNFQPIDKMMVAREFGSYQEYIKELNGFYLSLLENGPNLPNRELVFVDFIKKAAIEGAGEFLKQLTRQFEGKKTLWQEEKNHLLKKADEIRVELQRQISIKKDQLHQMDEENTELIGSLEACKQELEKLKLKNSKQEENFSRELKQRREQNEIETQQLLRQIGEGKQLLQEVEKDKYELEKELEKVSALHELKEQQFSEQIVEYKKKEALAISDMMQFKGETEKKYGKVLAETQTKLGQYKRKYEAKHASCEQMRQTIEQMQQTIDDLENANLVLSESSSKQSAKAKQMYSSKIGKYEELIDQLEKTLTEQQRSYQELESRFATSRLQSGKLSTELQEKLTAQVSEYKKEKAVYEQKVTFLELELKELEETHANNLQFCEARIVELERANREAAEKFSEDKVRQIQQQLQTKFKSIQKLMHDEKLKVENQVELIKKERANLAFELEMEKKAKETEVAKYKKVIETIEQQLTSSRESKSEFEETIMESHQKKVSQLQYRIKELEMELENYKEEQENYQQARSTESEQAVMQLKNYHELEKQKLEQKIIKEKEKYEKRIHALIQEHEDKLKQETDQLYEEIELIKDEAAQIQNDLRENLNHLQHDYDLKAKAYDSLETQYTEQKVFYEKKEIELVQKNQHLTLSLAEERESLQRKIDEITKEKTKFQKQPTTLAHQKDEITNISKSKDQKISSLEQQMLDLNKELEKSRALIRSKQSQLQNEFMEKIINYEKKIALIKQEHEFLLKKHQDFQKFTESKTKAYEEKIETLKSELQNAVKSSDEKRAKETAELEEKYEKIKKSSKQTQSAFTKRISSLERQLAIEQQKSMNLQTRLNEHKTINSSLEEKLSCQIQVLKVQFSEQKSQLGSKLQSLKQVIAQLQGEKQAINSEYEKEGILKENKIKYLEQSKEKTRKEMAEKVKKFEELLARAEKQRKQQKSSTEQTTSEHIKKLEKKHQEEIRELQGSFEKRQNEWEQRLKAAEVQNRKLSERAASNSHSSSETCILQERRLNELQDNQKRLLKELQNLKNSSKSFSNDTFLLYEKQKETLKSKLQDKQEKLRLAEKLKQEYFYELQKQKAKTNVEKQSFIMKIEELKETISKYERDLEKYQRENEKLKVEKRQSVSKANNLSRYSVNKSHFGVNNLTERSGLEESMSFLNVSVTSSIRGDTSSNREARSFNKMGKEYLRGYQQRMAESKENSDNHKSEKNSEQGMREKENFNPILDEESFFGNYV